MTTENDLREMARLQSHRDRLKAALERVMWVVDNNGPMASGYTICRGCHCVKETGAKHSEHCYINNALENKSDASL